MVRGDNGKWRRDKPGSFNHRRGVLWWVRIGLPLSLPTLVALELSLLHELLSL